MSGYAGSVPNALPAAYVYPMLPFVDRADARLRPTVRAAKMPPLARTTVLPSLFGSQVSASRWCPSASSDLYEPSDGNAWPCDVAPMTF